jgi:hypothetical protein
VELPEDLGVWSLQLIRTLATSITFEPAWLDFKSIVGGPATEGIRKDACAMANSAGGYLIFGVKDQADRKPGEDPVIGIDLSGKPDLGQHLGHLLQPVRQPVFFEPSPRPILISETPQRGIFVARIPLSPLRPHELEGKYWRRDSGGTCVAMTFYEVRDQMLLSEDRRKKVTLLRLELLQLVTTHEAMTQGTKGNANLAFDRFDTSSLKSLIADTCSILPGGNDVMRKLVSIDHIARRANVKLDRLNEHWLREYSRDPINTVRTHGPDQRRADFFSEAEDDRKEVVKLARECEQVLKEHFGDLSK